MPSQSQTKTKCLNCPKDVPCKCFSVQTDLSEVYFCSKECYHESNKLYSWDADHGPYDGHYFWCELGGEFEKKWKQAVDAMGVWQRTSSKQSQMIHQLRAEIKGLRK